MGEELYDCNVYIAENQAITVVSELTSGASVGVSMEGVLGLFATDYSKYNTADPSEYFFADNDAFAIVLNDSGNPVVEQGTYTVVYVGPDGTETQNEYTVGAEMTLAEVTAEEGKIGGWTQTEGGNSIDYTSGQNFAEGLGNAHGEVITLYAVEVRDLDTDVDEILSEIEDAVTEVNEAIENGTATDLQGALVALINAYKAADDELAAADTALKEELTSAYETAVKEAAETLDAAYKEADAELQAAIDAIDAAYRAADEALAGAIEELRAENAAQNDTIARQEEELNSLSIVLWVTLAVAVVALGVGAAGLVFGLKAKKKD